MNITLRSKIYIYLLLLPLFVFSQNKLNVDSLLEVINSSTTSSIAKSAGYYDLALNSMIENPKLSLKYLDKSIQLYSKHSPNEFQYNRFQKKAMIFRNLAQLDSAIYYHEKVLIRAKQENQYNYIASTYDEYGHISITQGNFEKAIEFFNMEIEIIKKHKLKSPISNVYNNMGIAYANRGDWNMAHEYFYRSTKYDLLVNNISALGNDFNNLGIVFMFNNQLDSSLKYINKGLEYRIRFKDKSGIGGSLNNLALLEKRKKNYSKALSLVDSAFKIATTYGFKKLESEVCESFKDIYIAKGDYKNAYDYMVRVYELRQEFNKEELSGKVKQLESDFQIHQKQSELLEKNLELTKSEKQKQKQTGIIFIGSLVLLASMIFLYTFFRNNKKLKDSNKIISEQKHLIEEKHKDITDSINYAQKIQSALIISEENLNKSLNEVFVIFKPRDIVSGDFYWFTEHNGVKIMAVADCTGHGVPGAFMSMIGITLLNKIVNEKNITSPAKILNNLRVDVIKALNLNSNTSDKSDGMDMSVIAFTNTELFYAGANSYAYLLEGKELVELKPNKQPIGVHIRNEEYTEQKIEIKSGSRIYLFSDGIVDQFGGEGGKKVKSKLFKDWLTTSSALSLKEQKSVIENNINQWKSGFEQTDDISLIGIKLG